MALAALAVAYGGASCGRADVGAPSKPAAVTPDTSSNARAVASAPHAAPETPVAPGTSTTYPSGAAAPAASAPSAEGTAFEGHRAARVLHVGDSMAPLVGFYLRRAFLDAGRRYRLETVDSSRMTDWLKDQKLAELVQTNDPDLVLLSLGSNELFTPNPEGRAQVVAQVAAAVGGRPCLWIGPPAWARADAMLAVMERHSRPCRWFESRGLTLTRMADGRHPDWKGGWVWANAVWRTLGGAGEVPRGEAGWMGLRQTPVAGPR